jgi:glycosyltransferase involved in cell wall biosynthesis
MKKTCSNKPHNIEHFDIICEEIKKAKLAQYNKANNSLRPILSIAIPTFNRELKLHRQVIQLIHQIQVCDISANVEIVISDNASTDRTFDIVNRINQENPCPIKLSYFRNESNLGVDANFSLAILRASGVYVWLLSDDDELCDDAIGCLYEKIIEWVDKSNTCIFVNYKITTAVDSPTAVPTIGKEMDLLLGEFMRETKLKFSLISCCVFRRDSLYAVDFNSHIGSNYIHMFVILQCLTLGCGAIIRRSLFKNDPPGVILSRRNSKIRDKGEGDFYLNAHLSFLNFVSSLLEVEKNWKWKWKYIRMISDENVNQIIYHKMTCEAYEVNYLVGVSLKMFNLFWYNPFFYLLHLPLLFLPSTVAKFIEPTWWKYLTVRGACMAKIRNFLKIVR